MGHPPFRTLDHTADIGLEFYGKDLAELFKNAGNALMDCLVERKGLSLKEYRNLSAEGGDSEELLVNFLRELLYMANGQGFLTKHIKIDHLDERMFSGMAGGEIFDAERHYLKMELKAVTYHGAIISEEKGQLKGRIIIDV
ncbi:MAG: archease [Syntrophales bacterium]|nr:archease [Syntrophales bacterium]